MWEKIREYLTFTRKERFGVLFLLLVICILFILPYFLRPHPGDQDPAVYEKLKEGIRKIGSGHPDSPNYAVVNDRYKNSDSVKENGNLLRRYSVKMHGFDPNKMGKEDWLQLGLPERVSLTISRYIERGGRFRRPEDLRKIYGLNISEYERLLPFVHITGKADSFARRSVYLAELKRDPSGIKQKDTAFQILPFDKKAKAGSYYLEKKLEITDVNFSDSADWSKLPGIGDRLASRIVHFRKKLGGFYRIDQVGETFGLPDTVFRKLKPVLRLSPPHIVQLDVNKASKEMLQAHPYIGFQIAKAIVTYRTQHGNFRSVDELLQLAQMDTQRFEKIKPYFTVYP
jgi:competence ComEA-like helix-hairpin-helix protein